MEFLFNKPEINTVTIPQYIIDRSENMFKKRYDNLSYVMKGHDKYDTVFGVRIPNYVDTSRPFVLIEDPFCKVIQGNDMFRAEDGTVFRLLRDENI